MRKEFLKKGANYLDYGADALNGKAKKIILGDKEFNDGIHSYDGVSEECINRLAKYFDAFDDDDDYSAFCQNLAIIAADETGKNWFWDDEGLSIKN